MTISLPTLRMLSAVLAIVLAVAELTPTPIYAAGVSKEDQAKLERYGKYGGPFTLIDKNGKTVSDTDFIGKYMFIFFGYTSCPDVCPTAMQTVSDSLDLMGDAGKDIQPIFITIDPERDTPKALADFTSNFSPRIIALTGDKKTINAVAKEYGVQFEKDFGSSSPDGASKSENKNYLISHSAATYLMNRKGRFLVLFPSGVSPEDMARNLKKIIKRY